MSQIREDIVKFRNALLNEAKKPKYKETEYHNYTIRTKTAPDDEGYFQSLAFHNQFKDRKKVVRGSSVSDSEKAAVDWIQDFQEQRTWDDIKGSNVTIDFNSSFIQEEMENTAEFWSKFVVIEGRPMMVVAPPDAEDDYGADTLREEGYSKASRKPSQGGAESNTAVTSVKKSRAVEKLLKPNARYTLSYTGKKTHNLGSAIYQLVFHSFVDAPNAPVRLGYPGVTVAASRQMSEADERDEEGRVKGDIEYKLLNKGDKIVANLKGRNSEKYTKLGQKIERIDTLNKELKELRAEVKKETKENVAGLFSADDAVRLRVIETLQFTFTLSKNPKPTESKKYKDILDELEGHLTPDLIKVLEDLKKKYTSTIEKEPGLKVRRTTGDQVSESIGSGIKEFFKKYYNKVSNWLSGYDRRLDKLKAEYDSIT